MSKCMDYSHKLQKDMPILHILSIIYELRKNQYKPIQYFCHEITQYTQSSHPFQNYLITS